MTGYAEGDEIGEDIAEIEDPVPIHEFSENVDGGGSI